MIYERSQGIPRAITNFCADCLVEAVFLDRDQVDGELAAEVIGRRVFTGTDVTDGASGDADAVPSCRIRPPEPGDVRSRWRTSASGGAEMSARQPARPGHHATITDRTISRRASRSGRSTCSSGGIDKLSTAADAPERTRKQISAQLEPAQVRSARRAARAVERDGDDADRKERSCRARDRAPGGGRWTSAGRELAPEPDGDSRKPAAAAGERRPAFRRRRRLRAYVRSYVRTYGRTSRAR